MPIIINEIEVLEPPPAANPSPSGQANPAPTPSPGFGAQVLELVRDAEGRQRRLVAD